MITHLDLTIPHVAQQVHTLQQLAYLVESRLIEYPNLPPLRDTVDTLQQADELFLGYHDPRQLVGVIAYERLELTLNICRLVVHPQQFGRGIASRLLQAIEYQPHGQTSITVSTAAKNRPAVALYQKFGYQIRHTQTLPDGLELVELEKRLKQEFVRSS